MNDNSSLEQRLARIESQLRAWRRGALAAVALLVVAVAGGAPLAEKPSDDPSAKEPGPQPVEGPVALKDDLQVRRLQVLDDQGKVRMELTAGAEGPAVTLLDADGAPQAAFFAKEIGPGISLWDKAGKPRLGLSILDDSGDLRLMDSKGQPWALLGEQQGRRIFVLAGADGGQAGLMLHNGDIAWSLAGGDGRSRVFTSIDKAGAKLQITNTAGKEVFRAP